MYGTGKPVSQEITLRSDGRAMGHCGTDDPTRQAEPTRRAPAQGRYAGSAEYTVLPEPQRLPMGYVAARFAAQEYRL